MPDDLGVGLTFELAPLGNQLVAQRLEILDYAIVDQRDRPDDVGVGVADGRSAMRRPARVGNASRAVERMLGKLAREIVELALGPPPLELAVMDRADTRGIVAPIFEALKAVEQPLRHVRSSDNSNDPTHALRNSFNAARAMPIAGNMGAGTSRTLNLAASAA